MELVVNKIGASCFSPIYGFLFPLHEFQVMNSIRIFGAKSMVYNLFCYIIPDFLALFILALSVLLYKVCYDIV